MMIRYIRYGLYLSIKGKMIINITTGRYLTHRPADLKTLLKLSTHSFLYLRVIKIKAQNIPIIIKSSSVFALRNNSRTINAIISVNITFTLFSRGTGIYNYPPNIN